MDEFGSPLAGGINAVRRNISSSFFSAPQRQAQPDPVTTDLLQQQSLQLTNVSQQLQGISRQISSVDFNLKSVKENLAVNEQLEKQREAAKQNRERILAEQGLREGKESALEAKIQTSLTQPLQRIGLKTQRTLGSLTQFLLTLAGGWLTITGIDLLRSLSEGNVDKINVLKTRFIGGLTVLAGTLTAMSIGIKRSFGILGRFAGTVGRVAFGGLLRAGLKGVQILLAGLVRKSGKIGGLSGGGSIVGEILQTVALIFSDRILKFLNPFKKKVVKEVVEETVKATASKTASRTARKTASKVKLNVAQGNIFQRGLNKTKVFVSQKAQVAKEILVGPKTGTTAAMLNRNTFKGGGIAGLGRKFFNKLFNSLPGKNALGKILGTLGVKGGVGTLFKKFGGPLATFVINLATGDGLGKALAATAGYAAASAATAKLLSPLLLAPIPGARILYGILVLAGGIVGETAVRKLYDGILGLFGFKKKKKKDKEEENKNVKIKTNEDGSTTAESVRTYSQEEVDALNAGGTLDAAGNVVPIKSNKNNTASTLSNFEDKPEIITLPMGNAVNQQGGGVSGDAKMENTLPTISFDTNNPHTLYATATTGAGN